MRSALLIFLYLLRDTLHRWLIRCSSPVARFLVVFFLSFCGLVFLSSYALSVEMLQKQIARTGGDLLVAVESLPPGSVHDVGHSLLIPRPHEYEFHLFHEPYAVGVVEGHPYPLVEYMPDSAAFFSPKHRNGLFFHSDRAVRNAGMPIDVEIDAHRLQAVCLPKVPLFSLLYPNGALFFPYGALPQVWGDGFIRKYVLKFPHLNYRSIERWNNILSAIAQWDKKHISTVDSKQLLLELANLERTQYRFRVGVSVGISFILCVLLTAVSSLEFRHNEYVYALMGSFGVSRLTLFFTFVAENCVLVTLGFLSALLCLWCCRDYLTSDLYRLPELKLSLWTLENDIRTFCLAFAICIPVSCLPILASVCRPIGKILK